MKPEHVLALQNFAHQQVYSSRILELLVTLLGKSEGMTNEMCEIFVKKVNNEASAEYEKLLSKLIGIFQTSFEQDPQGLSNFTPEELLKLLSNPNQS